MQNMNQTDLEKAGNLYSNKTAYDKLYNAYSFWAKMNLIQKHSTHDSIFFIFKAVEGFKIVKFYNDGIDYRISGYLETLSDAYNEAFQSI